MFYDYYDDNYKVRLDLIILRFNEFDTFKIKQIY